MDSSQQAAFPGHSGKENTFMSFLFRIHVAGAHSTLIWDEGKEKKSMHLS
jgi:hypothetical protein